MHRNITIRAFISKESSYIFGILGPTLVFLGCFISHFGIPNYSMKNFFVSELGDDSNPLAWSFNLFLTMGAIFNFLAIAKLDGISTSKATFWGVRIGMISAICVALIGIFPMSIIFPHTIAALSFFVSGGFAMGFFTVGFFLNKNPNIPKWLGFTSLIVWLSFLGFGINPSKSFVEVFGSGIMILEMHISNRPSFWELTFFEWMILITLNSWIMFMNAFQIIIKKNITFPFFFHKKHVERPSAAMHDEILP